jgi:integrase
MLRPRSLDLPPVGWGRIWVTEAEDGEGLPALPKSGKRSVPVPHAAVAWLQTWCQEKAPPGSALLFHIDRYYQVRWRSALQGACTALGVDVFTPYEIRHTNATMMIRAGVPMAEAARRLGHTVEMLVSTYIGAMDGDEKDGNRLIEQELTNECNTAANRGAQGAQ